MNEREWSKTDFFYVMIKGEILGNMLIYTIWIKKKNSTILHNWDSGISVINWNKSLSKIVLTEKIAYGELILLNDESNEINNFIELTDTSCFE